MAKSFHRFYANIDKRIKIEERLINHEMLHGGGFENMTILHKILIAGLKITGMQTRGLRNLFKIRTITRDVYLPRLPKAFDGTRILHLSDIHLDGINGLSEKVCEVISELDYDLCVITGDFRYGKRRFSQEQIEPTLKLLQAIKAPLGIWGVLGNHDCIEVAEVLEKNGVRMLMNEHEIIYRENDEIALIGIDDPHLYKCDDLPRAMSGIRSNLCKVLFVHTPEVVREAADAGIDLYLCGHTHGGQIALPGGFPLYLNARCSRAFGSGPFAHKNMLGYTHRGTGASSVPVRFNCPPEIVIHTLRHIDFELPAPPILLKAIKERRPFHRRTALIEAEPCGRIHK